MQDIMAYVLAWALVVLDWRGAVHRFLSVEASYQVLLKIDSEGRGKTMKVRCVETLGAEKELLLGKEYEVLQDHPHAGAYTVMCEGGLALPWRKGRFVVVDHTPVGTEEACPDTLPSLPRHLEQKALSLSPTPSKAAKGDDGEREREMRFFRASCQPNTCGKCGQALPCDYHPTHPQGWDKV